MHLKLGLEVHAQLQAPHKLFSRAKPSFAAVPNSRVAFFDAALPGTQPRLTKACLNLAIRAALALNAHLPARFSFDRKHYMYPDQPSGYQITQLREPIAVNGYLDLLPRDFRNSQVNSVRRIELERIQLEQDTGKTNYVDGCSLIDLNRANTGLVEIVTTPCFKTEDEAAVFVRKLQHLLRRVKVCSGEMETGAMRVDVNVSVADKDGRDLGDRCEIKNLFSTSAVRHAIKAEFSRQCRELKSGNPILRETRGWDGQQTFKLRSKELAQDYRYMPDPDIPAYLLPRSVVNGVRQQMPEYPDAVVDRLVGEPYLLSVPDAMTVVGVEGAPELIEKATSLFVSKGGRNVKLIGTWLANRWLGSSSELPNVQQFVDVLLAVDTKQVSTTTGRLILKHMAQGYTGSVQKLISEFKLSEGEPDELELVCQEVLEKHADVLEKVRNGKKNAIGFLLGQIMKETQGVYDPKEITKKLVAASSVNK